MHPGAASRLGSYITLTPLKINANGGFETTGINCRFACHPICLSMTAVSWNLTLVPPPAVIEQEEPAFVGPARALLVRVSALLDDEPLG
jgi:hypothetical protein